MFLARYDCALHRTWHHFGIFPVHITRTSIQNHKELNSVSYLRILDTPTLSPLGKEIVLDIAIVLSGKDLHLLLQLPFILILVNFFDRIARTPSA